MMLKNIEKSQVEKLRSKFREHPLLLTCQQAFRHYMASMESFNFTSEDLFVEAAIAIDEVFDSPTDAPQYLEDLWDNLKIKLKSRTQPTPTQADLNIVCGVLFYVVAATMSLHWREFYNKEIVGLLRQIVGKKGFCVNEEEQKDIIENLCKHSEGLEVWVNEYEDSEDWITDEIDACLRDNQAMEPKRKLSEVLDTELAQEIFAKCIEKCWMHETENGYHWEGIPETRGKVAQLAYMCGKIYGFNYSDKQGRNVGAAFPDSELSKLFNEENLEKQLVQVYQAKYKQKWRVVIDKLFE